MPPLFPHQAFIFQPQTAAPPYNEVLDSLLTGYLWACLLVTLILITYFAISFCAWVLSTVLATTDAVLDCLQSHHSDPDTSTDVEITASPWQEKYGTMNSEQANKSNEIGSYNGPMDRYETAFRYVLSNNEIPILHPENFITDHADLTEKFPTHPAPSSHTPRTSTPPAGKPVPLQTSPSHATNHP
jgi:hypothetical protein